VLIISVCVDQEDTSGVWPPAIDMEDEQASGSRPAKSVSQFMFGFVLPIIPAAVIYSVFRAKLAAISSGANVASTPLTLFLLGVTIFPFVALRFKKIRPSLSLGLYVSSGLCYLNADVAR
jgi:hypothetical protein